VGGSVDGAYLLPIAAVCPCSLGIPESHGACRGDECVGRTASNSDAAATRFRLATRYAFLNSLFRFQNLL